MFEDRVDIVNVWIPKGYSNEQIITPPVEDRFSREGVSLQNLKLTSKIQSTGGRDGGLEPIGSLVVEESFLKTHGSANQLFENFIKLKTNTSTGPENSTWRDGPTWTPPQVPTISDLDSPRYVLRERLAMGRLLNSSKHNISISQQTPPEEVLQRIEQALAVHLGSDFIRENVYSHYGSWLPKYGLFRPWGMIEYNPDSLTKWNSVHLNTLTKLIRGSD